jgi:hypothetical protein
MVLPTVSALLQVVLVQANVRIPFIQVKLPSFFFSQLAVLSELLFHDHYLLQATQQTMEWNVIKQHII